MQGISLRILSRPNFIDSNCTRDRIISGLNGKEESEIAVFGRAHASKRKIEITLPFKGSSDVISF